MAKDIIGLFLYIPALCLSIKAPVYFCFFLFSNLDYIDPLLKPINLILVDIIGENSTVLDTIALAYVLMFLIPIAFIIIWLPMYITNYALDKKWSRILNIFFENIQYSTLFLILLITLQLVFKNLDLWLYIIFYIFIYLGTVARKFFKELK